MAGELVFTVDGAAATAAQPIALSEAGLRERQHLQEWVIAHPEVLGSDVRIVAFEFGKWSGSGGGVELDRLDVLALDAEGTLVVVELKRDKAPDTVEMQALKYAALVSRFTRDDLDRVHAAFLTKQRGEPVDVAAAAAELDEWATITDDNLRQPRLILMATQFPKTVTATVVFLHQQLGLDVRLLAFQAYRTANDVIITVSQHYPPPDVEEFVLSPEVSAERKEKVERQKSRKDASTVSKLVAAGALEMNELLVFGSPSPSEQAAVQAWLDEQPERARARWQDDTKNTLRWDMNGELSSTTGLAQKILIAALGKSRALQGPLYWHAVDGRSLLEIAQNLPGSDPVPFEERREMLAPALRAVLDDLDAGVLELGEDVTRRAKIYGLAYYGTRKLCDVRFRTDILALQISDPDGVVDSGSSLIASVTSRYVQVNLASVADVAPALALLRPVFDKQAAQDERW